MTWLSSNSFSPLFQKEPDPIVRLFRAAGGSIAALQVVNLTLAKL